MTETNSIPSYYRFKVVYLLSTWARKKCRNNDYDHNNELDWLPTFISDLFQRYNDYQFILCTIERLYEAEDFAYTKARLMIFDTDTEILLKPKKLIVIAPKAHIYSDIQIVCLED